MTDDNQTIIMILAAIYFTPAVVAVYRQHRSAAAIAVLNVLLGWTLLGWIVALIWAFTGNTNQKIIVGNGWNRRVVDENALRIKVLEAQLRAASPMQPIIESWITPIPPEPTRSNPEYWAGLDKINRSRL